MARAVLCHGTALICVCFECRQRKVGMLLRPVLVSGVQLVSPDARGAFVHAEQAQNDPTVSGKMARRAPGAVDGFWPLASGPRQG